MRTGYEIVVDSNRLLNVEVSGKPDGVPVFLFHGTPGSRNGPKPRSTLLYRLGVQLITYDRPGYGGSTRQPGRRVADAAHDVEAIADRLKLGRVAVVGRSGGGPHALATMALLADRVTRALVLVGLAPSNAPGLRWYDGMSDDNVREYSTADEDSGLLTRSLAEQAARTVANPESLIDQLRTQMSEPDLRFMQNVLNRKLISRSYAEALREGPYGWIDDVIAFRDDWGFALGAIDRPVLLWHGSDDTFSPASHTRWLADQIPHAEVRMVRNAAHFAAMDALPGLLPWLAHGAGVEAGPMPLR